MIICGNGIIELFPKRNLEVFFNYYLVIEGGKVGTYFMEHAVKNEFPFVLVIDRDENALSRTAKVLTNESELVSLLKNKAASLYLNKHLNLLRQKKKNMEITSRKQGQKKSREIALLYASLLSNLEIPGS